MIQQATRSRFTEVHQAAPPSLRELETPYSVQGVATSVATPSCCSCCCCCVTALTIGPVLLGFDTHSAAVKKGRKGVWPGVVAALALPVPSIAAMALINTTSGEVAWLLWFVASVAAVSAARAMAGQSWNRALLWGLLVPLAWLFLLAVNLIIDIPLWFGTNLWGALIEIALVPLWIFLIARGIRRRRVRHMAITPGRPGYQPLPTVDDSLNAAPSASFEPPPPPAPGDWAPDPTTDA